MTISNVLNGSSLCRNCQHIEFFPMKTMTPARWKTYFPFLHNRPDLISKYEEKYQSFLNQVPDEFEFEAILHPTFESLQWATAVSCCAFCRLIKKRLRSCYRGLPSSPDEDRRDNIIAFPPVARPEEDLDELRSTSPMLWLELSMPAFDGKDQGLSEALQDACIRVKLANTVVHPRFLLSGIRPTDSSGTRQSRCLVGSLSAPRNRNVSTSSKQNMQLARRWLEECKTKHANCKLADKRAHYLPLRLLDLQAPRLGKNIRLCVSTEPQDPLYREADRDPPPPYATLSHRWGECHPLKTLHLNYSHHTKCIRFKQLPKTFQDAVNFTRKMGVRYLWIDSLCLVQDDDGEKEREIPHMAYIYSHAVFNIAACAAEDSGRGLFSRRDTSWLYPQQISFGLTLAEGHRESLSATCSPVQNDFAVAGERGNFLDDRGWIFQERGLSKRVFSFEKDMLWFECWEIIASENLPAGAPRHISRNPFLDKWELLLPGGTSGHRELSQLSHHLFTLSQPNLRYDLIPQTTPESLYRQWHALIPTYTSRTFTYERDRLPGISGLASSIQTLTNEIYLAGLWKSHLIDGLCWSVYRPHRADKPSPPIYFTDYYRAPSWSWANLHGPVSIQSPFASPSTFSPHPECTVVSAYVKPRSVMNACGDAEMAYLCLRGRIKTAQAWSVATPSGGKEATYGVASLFPVDTDCSYTRGGFAHAYMDDVEKFIERPKNVWVMAIASYIPEVRGERKGKKLVGLVLEKLEDGEDRFRREGLVWRFSRGGDEEWDEEDEDRVGSWFGEGTEEREVVIV
ncbi:HET-domain-containing protein [Sporormia fimetaria CBS 119925]|uniref:HET-domain-containing protein n=1 Tax=Sporormia fimetaria CBS 119925 TaxID=1340428 RepID=A0A6A6VAE7_9PLEO|nr:HET-domain-containing protein [Sporormia fimetaria CBS 119925]